MSKYFLYARKSTDVEDKQVRSIEDQLSVLRALAKDEQLEISEEFVEKRSAKTPGRPIFNEMLTKLQNSEASGIICWKLDRLARNPIDGGQISWMLQKEIIEHIRTFDRSYYPQDNVLIMSVEFGMANQYILDLRANTKRGLMEKVKRKEYPSLAPIGYLNDTRTKKVAIDKKKAKVVREAFELYAQNNSRLEDIAEFFAQHEIRTRHHGPFKRDKISWILSNPFYYGLFRYAGELYEGSHEPIISKRLFDKVQTVMQQRGKPQKSHWDPLVFCGLLRCGTCGMTITGGSRTKRQKNGNVHKYFYYHCTRKSKTVKCFEPTIREEILDHQLSRIIQNFVLPESWARELQDMLAQDEQRAMQSTDLLIGEAKQEIAEVNEKLQRLLAVYLEQDVDRDSYHREKAVLLSAKKSLEGKIDELLQGQHAWIKPLQEWIKDAQESEKIAHAHSLSFKKSHLQKICGLNLFLENREVGFTPQNQWASLREAHQKVSKNNLSLVLVEMPGVKPGSKTFSPFNYSQD
jgi:site-specific DNA recombinase